MQALSEARHDLATSDLRAALNLHGSNLVVSPAHGLQRGVVIVYLPLASHEVLPLEQHHLGLLVVLCAHEMDKVVKHQISRSSYVDG